MNARPLAIVALLFAAPLGAQQLTTLSSSWKVIVPGKRIYATADSIRSIGVDAYRGVVVIQVPGIEESVETIEVHCKDKSYRTTRSLSRGPGVRPNSQGQRVQVDVTANATFARPNVPGGNDDLQVRGLCELARSVAHPK